MESYHYIEHCNNDYFCHTIWLTGCLNQIAIACGLIGVCFQIFDEHIVLRNIEKKLIQYLTNGLACLIIIFSPLLLLYTKK